MLLLGNVGQQLDIGDLTQEITGMQNAFAQNQQADHEQGQNIEQLKRENQELKLYLATLVRLLVSKGVLKPEEVETIVRTIEK